VTEVVGHLADAERIFAYRLLRIGRGDETPLAGFDENAYVPGGAFDYRSLPDVLDEWVSVRNSTIALVRGMPPGAWASRGRANDKVVTAGRSCTSCSVTSNTISSSSRIVMESPDQIPGIDSDARRAAAGASRSKSATAATRVT
jgi:hypothetical protein